MFKLLVFFSLFLNLQAASAQKVSFFEVKETSTQTFGFDLYVHSECLIAEPGALICAYNIGEGDFTETDFDLKITYDRTRYQHGKGTLVKELAIVGAIIVVEFEVAKDQEGSGEEQLESALLQVNESLLIAPHKLTLTYYGEGFDKAIMSEPTAQLSESF